MQAYDERLANFHSELIAIKSLWTELRQLVAILDDENATTRHHLRIYNDQVKKQTDGLFHDLRGIMEENYQLRRDLTQAAATRDSAVVALTAARDDYNRVSQQRDSLEKQCVALREANQELLSKWEASAQTFESTTRKQVASSSEQLQYVIVIFSKCSQGSQKLEIRDRTVTNRERCVV